MGRWRLADQIDTSHRFLYAHRFWPQIKAAIAAADSWPAALPAMITQIADAAVRTSRVDRDRLLGITAVGLMTLRQVGAAALAAAPGAVNLTDAAKVRSPHQVLQRRAKDDWQGWFGFTRGDAKRWTVRFDESDPDATSGHQRTGDHGQGGKMTIGHVISGCIPNEGPIPVECRAAPVHALGGVLAAQKARRSRPTTWAQDEGVRLPRDRR
jgi:hypothetical protein